MVLRYLSNKIKLNKYIVKTEEYSSVRSYFKHPMAKLCDTSS